MTATAPRRASRRRAASPAPVVRPLERAQVVWQRAVALADPTLERDQFAVALDLLRAAHHGPSTMLHALMLGRAQQQDRPDDPVLREAVRVLEHATTWLGAQTSEGEVGHGTRQARR